MRRLIEKTLTIFAWASSMLVVIAIALIVIFLLKHGLEALNLELFFGDVSLWDALTGAEVVWDGIWPACVGTVYLVFLSSVIAIPMGIASGIFLAQYSQGVMKSMISFAIDVLAGIPSIVMGLFGFAMVLFLKRVMGVHATTCLLLSAVCIAMLILPYVIRTTQVSLEGVPESLKLEGQALGLTMWQTVVHILLPHAAVGIMSGMFLAVGRAAEDTAVIMLTGVVANAGIPYSLAGKFEALPFVIYYQAAEYRTPEDLQKGFGAALVLLMLTTTIFIGARMLQKIMEKRWKCSRI